MNKSFTKTEAQFCAPPTKSTMGGESPGFVAFLQNLVALITLFLCLLSLVLTLHHKSQEYGSLELQHLRTNSSFANEIEKLRQKFDNVLKKILNEIKQKIEQQDEKFQTSLQNETEARLKLEAETSQQLTMKFESLFNRTGNINMTISNKSEAINDLVKKVTRQLETLDNYAKSNLSHSMSANKKQVEELGRQFQSLGFAPSEDAEVRGRLDLTQEIWRKGNLSLAFSRGVSQATIEKTVYNEILETYKGSPEVYKRLMDVTKDLVDIFYESTKINVKCGGSFKMAGPTTFRYERFSNSSDENRRPCIWIMWTVLTSSMTARMIDLSGEVAIYTHGNMTSVNTWTTSRPLAEHDTHSNIAVVLFTPRSPQSISSNGDIMEICFGFKDSTKVQVDVSMSTLIADLTVQPIDGQSGRKHDERSYTFIYPPADRKVSFQVTSINTEWKYDFLQVFKYSNETRKFETGSRYTGTSVSSSVFEGYLNQPILLYFYTDGSGNSEGYCAIYSSTTN